MQKASTKSDNAGNHHGDQPKNDSEAHHHGLQDMQPVHEMHHHESSISRPGTLHPVLTGNAHHLSGLTGMPSLLCSVGTGGAET